MMAHLFHQICKVVLIAAILIMLWVRFVGRPGITITDATGGFVVGLFSAWVLLHLIAGKILLVLVIRQCMLAVTIVNLTVISAADAVFVELNKQQTGLFILDGIALALVTTLAILDIDILDTPPPPQKRHEHLLLPTAIGQPHENDDDG